MQKGQMLLFFIRVIVFTVVLFLVGGTFNYFPFVGEDGAIWFCTVIICGVIAVCTCKILSAIEGIKGVKDEIEKKDHS